MKERGSETGALNIAGHRHVVRYRSIISIATEQPLIMIETRRAAKRSRIRGRTRGTRFKHRGPPSPDEGGWNGGSREHYGLGVSFVSKLGAARRSGRRYLGFACMLGFVDILVFNTSWVGISERTNKYGIKMIEHQHVAT